MPKSDLSEATQGEQDPGHLQGWSYLVDESALVGHEPEGGHEHADPMAPVPEHDGKEERERHDREHPRVGLPIRGHPAKPAHKGQERSSVDCS